MMDKSSFDRKVNSELNLLSQDNLIVSYNYRTIGNLLAACLMVLVSISILFLFVNFDLTTFAKLPPMKICFYVVLAMIAALFIVLSIRGIALYFNDRRDITCMNSNGIISEDYSFPWENILRVIVHTSMSGSVIGIVVTVLREDGRTSVVNIPANRPNSKDLPDEILSFVSRYVKVSGSVFPLRGKFFC